jgi:hypothetical protein
MLRDQAHGRFSKFHALGIMIYDFRHAGISSFLAWPSLDCGNYTCIISISRFK